mmetsp:Transcript_77254/g.226559  ORF Transcript_77254/g.226559 Transcript_77254/m.226559 type:complete len:400 (+) Transcript_77254:38-1237(+)
MPRAPAMSLDNFFEEEDEGHSLLSSPSSSSKTKTLLTDLASKAEGLPRSFGELSWQAKLAAAVVVVTFVGIWERGHGAGGHPVGLKLRGLENGDELKWAEDTFGVFLKAAIPALEGANAETHNFLNMLSQGRCEDWAKTFAEKGVFSFNLPHLQGEFTKQKEVRDAFCRDTGSQIRATRLVWNFPDAERLSGLALYEVFRRSSPEARAEKARWAQFARLTKEGGQLRISEFRLYMESPEQGQLKDAVDGVVQAKLRQLNGHDCAGFEAALPSAGTETWVVQSLPTGSGKKDELDEKPRDQLLAKCKRDTAGDWKSIDFQYASIEGVFTSARDREAMVFFHKEKRYKGVIDMTDDPEAILVKLTGDGVPQVHSLYFFYLEGVHLSEEWGWRYGWASHQHR